MKALLASALIALPTALPAQGAPAFDTHVHIWQGEASIRDYDAQMRRDGRQVTHFGAIHMAVRGRIAETRAKNDELIAIARRDPRVVPIASVHPYDEEAALAELDRLGGGGIRMIKLHPGTQGFDVADPRVKAIAERAGRHGIAVLIDNASVVPGDNQKLFQLAISTPGTRFVFAHMGGMEFRYWNLLALVRTTQGFFADNIWFDLSGTMHLIADSPIEDELVWTIRNVGVDRVMIGSDWPQFSVDRTLRALDALDLTDEEKQKLRWGNAAALLLGPRLPPPGPQLRRELRGATE